jgi:HEAT repeat protein
MAMEEFLEILTDPSADVASADFVEISDLSPSELGGFARAWFTIPVDHQRLIISTMVGLAEDNPELDFCAVFKMCLKDQDEVVQGKAIEGLWEYEDRSIITGLVQILRSDRSPEVRSAAAAALGKFASLIQEGKLLPKDAEMVRDNLMDTLEDQEEHLEVRRRSLEAVAPFNTATIQEYVSWAYNSDDLKLKSSSIYAMGRTGEATWLPVLIKELQSSEPSVRYETANACGDLGDEEVVPHLVPLLEDDDYQVQVAGLSALGKIGGPLAKRVLLRCIKEGDAVLEEAARGALESVEFLEDPIAYQS